MNKRKQVQISELNDHPRNAEHRSIDDESKVGLKASIIEGSRHHPDNGCFRLDTSVTINRNGNRILGGHRRIEVLAELGQDFVHADDCTWVDYEIDSPEELACVVKLNSPSISGEYTEGLGDVLRDLNSMDGELFESLRFDDLATAQSLELFSESATSPNEFTELDENIETEHRCPKCGYEFSGGKTTNSE